MKANEKSRLQLKIQNELARLRRSPEIALHSHMGSFWQSLHTEPELGPLLDALSASEPDAEAVADDLVEHHSESDQYLDGDEVYSTASACWLLKKCAASLHSGIESNLGWPYRDGSRESECAAFIRVFVEPVCDWLQEKLASMPLDEEVISVRAPLQTANFNFIQGTALRAILARDYTEIQKALGNNCWKSAIVLSGGSIEAVLLDVLQTHSQRALASSKAPKGKGNVVKPLEEWGLYNLIEVATDLQLTQTAVGKLSHPIREYRNLIHPAVEMRSGLTVDRHEAIIAVELLNILIRDLS